jgi:hypothetical protein
MKTFVSVLAAALVSISLFSCKKVKNVVEFDVPVTATYTISPSAMPAWQEYISTTAVTTDIAQRFSDQGTNSDLVGEVKCTSFKLELTSPASGADLNFIDGIRFFLNATNQKEVQQAFRYNDGGNNVVTPNADTIKGGVKSIDLHLNGPSVKNYLIENAFDLKMKAVPHKTLTSSVVLKASLTFHVKGID